MPEFNVRREVTLFATPEEVWEAVATDAGSTAWLFPIGQDATEETAQVWDPPHHLVVRQEQGDWYNALEFIIEGRDGGTTLLRYMHSGIIVDNWDDQYDAVNAHTDFYLHTLGQYLQYFKGRTATYIGYDSGGIQAPMTTATPDGFTRFQRALGIPESVNEGDTVHLTAGPDVIDGVVDYLQPHFLGIRTADALYCFFGRNAFGGPVGMSVHSFAPDIDAEAAKTAWQEWLNTTFA